VTAPARVRPSRRSRLPLETLVPLFAAYFALAALYAWQAWRRETPTIFTDELELTQISRSIADTGEPARRGVPYGFTSLAPWLTAPAWWIHSVTDAFETVKYLQTLVMTAAIFPAYALARTVVSRPWALFAAVATVAAPALSYAPILVEEPLAYPAAALAFLLVARAVAQPGWGRVTAAAAACALAAGLRSQLVALFGVLALSLVVLAWGSEPARRWRGSWSRWDWTGAVALGLGLVFFSSAVLSTASHEWSRTTVFFKGRILEYGLWAAGAFAIGVGILPVIAALASLVRPRAQWRADARLRAYVIVSVTAFVSLGFYAAVKGAYLSTTFSSLVVERNLIYLTPLVFAGTALVLERLDAPWWAAVPAGALVLWAVAVTPTKVELYPYYEAHGLSILALANRAWEWPNGRIETAVVVIAVVATAIVVALGFLRKGGTGARVAVVTLAALVLGWNLTNELYAASGERDLSERFARAFVQPPDWVDRAVGDGSVVVVGQQFGNDTNDIHLLEFWNRSVGRVWSVDPNSPAPGPGPTQTPDLERSDGTLVPGPETDYALAVRGVALQAPVVARRPGQTLYRLDGKPLKIAFTQTGVYSDSWMSRDAAYNRFDIPPGTRGLVRIDLVEARCAPGGPTVNATVRVGPLRIGGDKQPELASVTDEVRLPIEQCGQRHPLLRLPGGPWRAEVEVDETYVPAQLDPSSSDARELGLKVGFSFRTF
jgi:hypothetical protein